MRGSRHFPLAVLIRIGLAVVRLTGHIGLIEELEYFDVERIADFSAAAMKHHGVINLRCQRVNRVEIGVKASRRLRMSNCHEAGYFQIAHDRGSGLTADSFG